MLRTARRSWTRLAVANAHPLGAQPFGARRLHPQVPTLTEGIITPREAHRFLEAVQDLPRLPAGELPA